MTSRRSLLKYTALSLTGLALSGFVAACSSPQKQASSGSSDQPIKLTLVSYAVTQKAYEQIIPKFAEQWKAKTGQTVDLRRV